MSIVFDMYKSALGILIYPIYFVLIVFAFFALLVFIHVFYGMVFKHKKFIKPTIKSTFKKISAFKRIFYLFPKQISLDLLSRNPDDFRASGLIIFTGRQGKGKTVSMVKCIYDLQHKYPLAKTLTNFAYKYQDTTLDHWKRLIDYNNGSHGVICGIDETQNWFSSNQSKNFPPEMLGVITQNRKNRRIILGTAQNFYLLAKAIRSQATEVRSCITLFGCLTIVKRSEPILDSTGDVIKYRHLGFYFFVHDEELRNSYDTYKCIESLKHSGFQDKTILDINVS